MGPPKNVFKTFHWHWAWRQQLEKLDITNNTLTGSNRQGREILQKLHNFCVRGDIAKVFQIYKWNKKELRKWRLLTVTYIANTGYLTLGLDQFLTNKILQICMSSAYILTLNDVKNFRTKKTTSIPRKRENHV